MTSTMDSNFRGLPADSPVFGLARATVLGRRALDLSHLALAGTVLGADDGQKLFFPNSSEFHFSVLSRGFSRNGPSTGTPQNAIMSALSAAGRAKLLEIDNSQNFTRCCCFCVRLGTNKKSKFTVPGSLQGTQRPIRMILGQAGV